MRKKKAPMPKPPKQTCSRCGGEFQPKRRRTTTRYCSSKCRYDDWNEQNPRVKRDDGGGHE